jgi:hypothetical protein
MHTKAMAVVTIVALVVGVVAMGACEDLNHGRVPSDAKPTGFKQLARWDSCGASGQYCADVIIFGRSDISFEDGIRDVETRYRKKGWNVNTVPAGGRDDGGLIISNPDKTTCVLLVHFNILKYAVDLGAPDAMTMAKLVEPYSTAIRASAGICG